MLKEDPLYNEAMERYTDVYVDFIHDTMDALTLAGKRPQLYLETRLDYSRWVP